MKKFLTFLALACLTVTGAWAAEPTTGQLFTLTTPGRGGWCCVDGQMKGTKQSGVTVTDDKQKYFAFVEYNGSTYLWNEAEKKFASSSGAMGSILIATPINWTAQDGGSTYFFNFGAGKYVNLGGSNQLAIDGWSSADAGNKMTLTPVEGYDAAAVQAAIDAETQKAVTTITWNVKDGNNNVVASQTLENCVEGTSYTTSLNAYGATIFGDKTVTATKVDQTIDLTYTVDYTLIPFQFSDSYGANANWYKLTIRSKYVYYDAANNKCNVTNDAPASVSKKDLFAFLGNPFNVVIINAALGEGKAFTAPLQDNGLLTGADINNASGFSFENNDNHYVFRGNGSTDCYVNQLGSGLGYWKSSWGATDNGSTFTFTAAGDVSDLFVLDADLVAAKTEALATLNTMKIPALFPAADVAKAIQDINGIEYNNTDATSVSEATTTLNNIMTSFWALPNGKKFTYASWMNGGSEQAPRYLEAATAAGALTTSTAITPNNIFELENVGGANYKVKAVYQNAYLNSTNTAAEGSIYNLIYQGSENYVSLQFNGTTNAIHHQASGNKPVSWGTSSDASKWHITAVSDEEYNELAFGIALKAALDEAADAYAVNDTPLTEDDIDDDLITDGSQFYSPYTYADDQKVEGVVATEEQVYSFLLDKDVNTYWHSQWNAGNQPAHKHYLQVTLTEPISGSVLLTMNRRKTNADQITKMSVEYSTDGNTYTQLPGHMTFPTGTNGEQIQGTFHLPTNASYLRFYEDETTNNRGYWHCSEFQLNKVTNSRNIEHTTEAAALQSAIATATAAFNSGSYTQATIDALLAAIETYKNAVDAAPATITYEYKIGDEIVDTEVIESVVGAEYPAPKTFEFYTQSAKPTGTISESGTYTINLTWDGPFEFTTINGSDFAEGTKWYYMQNGNNNGNGYVVYGNGEDKRSSMTTTAGTDDTYKWCFVRKTGSTAFYLYNKAADAIALHEELSSDAQHPEWATNHNQGFCVAKTDGVNDMPLILRANNNGYSLQLAGEGITGTCLLGKHVNSYLSIWGNSANVTNDGCRFTFEEALDLPEKTYVFYLTDADGNEYTGTFTSSEENARPACVAGFTLSNEGWDDVSAIRDDVDYVYTADFEFPFPVNTPTAISGFAGYNAPFWWRAAGNDIVVKAGDEAVGNDYAWIITPAFADNTFTYTFQSVKTEKYVKVNATDSNHNQGAVTLDEKANATLFTYTSDSFQAVGQTLYLSVNSSDTPTDQYVGVHNAIHNGSRMHFGDIVPAGLDITIGELGYATFYDEVNRAIPEGVKAYYCNYNEGTGNLDTKDITEETGLTYIPAYVGVVLEGESGDYTLEEVAEIEEDYDAIAYIFTGEDGYTFSALSGTVDEITLAQAKEDYSAENIYVFSKKNDKLGFYKYIGSTLAAHKAFYAPEAASEIQGFSLDFGGQTVGVSSVISATNLKAGYDIQGRRINKVQKGINILNGKKIIK